ncbi:MAG: phosphoglucosamine mutase [Candidatus Omnitrophota bacterium]
MIEQHKLFGTDGIRQQVGRFPLDEVSIYDLGRAFGRHLSETGNGAKIICGRDTRMSGKRIEQLFTAGLLSVSPSPTEGDHPIGTIAIHSCGVIPTPGLSYIAEHGPFDYGVMITASHNPYTDNGLKFFGSDGEKISDELEQKIEAIFFSHRSSPEIQLPEESGETRDNAPDCVVDPCDRIHSDFLAEHAAGLADALRHANPLKIVMDCANGATSEIAPRIFHDAGLNPVVIHHIPDGKNINFNCGSTHMDSLKEVVRQEGADLGIAFDGDGDRVLFTDGAGHTLDGNHTLYILSKYLRETSGEFNGMIVGTLLGNLGPEKALNRLGITYIRTDVGDKHVWQEMKRTGALLGGEPSGHTILRHFQKTGSGILTALYVLKSLAYFHETPLDIFNQLPLYPQVERNITVRERRDFNQWDQLKEMRQDFDSKHGRNSRLVIRYSGTEPKLRLMMESEDPAVIAENIGKFETLIQSTIG